MRHGCQARSPCFWLRLEWRLLIGVESWAFAHRRRGPILGWIVARLERTYNRQKPVTKMTSRGMTPPVRDDRP